MSIKSLCLPRSHSNYALRFNYLSRIQLPAKLCEQYSNLIVIRTYSDGTLKLGSNSSSENVAPNKSFSGLQKDRQRAAETYVPADESKAPLPPSGYIRSGQLMMKDKVNSIYQFYDRFSHTNEIREAHDHVERLQEELKAAQQKRWDIAKQMNDTRYELQVCNGELFSCQKGEPRYLELIRKEYEIHHKEKQLTEEFNQLDKTERDLFIHLQAAVKTSHEKEKIHTNSAKYWSIVGSLLGALLGICGTAFSFYNRNRMITTMLAEVQSEFVVLRTETTQIRQELQQLVELQRRQIERERSMRFTATDTRPSTVRSNESWLHWIGRRTYAITAYRYFVPNSV